jgi:uncharacterized SAM-binding protein YcdF (DUF218 family)
LSERPGIAEHHGLYLRLWRGRSTINADHNLARRKNQGARAITLRRYLAIVFVLATLCAGAWIERETLLRGIADLWIVSDTVTPADAVVVLGGGIEVRPFVAADLYSKCVAKKVLLSEVDKGRPVSIGAVPGETELDRKVLVRLGVPESAIETFGISNKNTWEEAATLKDWADRNGPSVLIIPTEVFSARRVRWTFRREFAGTSVRIEVPSFDPPSYNRAAWWKSADGVITFQNEVLKYLYYRLKY